MELRRTISQEMLAVGATSKLGPIIEQFITDYRALDSLNDSTAKKLFTDFTASIKKECGLEIALEIDPSIYANAWVYCDAAGWGHSGTRYTSRGWRIEADDLAKGLVLKIDLKRAKLTGNLLTTVPSKMGITRGLLNEKAGFTIREITAIILHEIGHLFNMYLYLGDYVWLNYYLTEGVEALLGNKRTTIKTEILDEEWLKENVEPELWEAFANDRTESTTRLVVLSGYKKRQRHHITNNPVTAQRREEQMADMFPTRLGYGRDMVSGLYKMDRDWGGVDDSGYTRLANVMFITSLLFPITTPIVILSMVFDSIGKAVVGHVEDMAGRYDNNKERLEKIRRDLIHQLKSIDLSDDRKRLLLEETKFIEDIIKEYTVSRTFYDRITTSLVPSARKRLSDTQLEENLEALVNNDLFVKAFQLKLS